jgi:membrane protease YdiL (CAAX protease family)
LYYLPLVIIASTSFWGGVKLQYGFPGASLFFISMCCVGFLEEVILRGLLFRAMEKDNPRTAIIVSSLTFGLGHIVNLFNGSGKDLPSTIVQIIFAILVGFVLVLIFYYGKSLIPCILFHSANNALKVFAAEGNLNPRTEMVLNLILIVVVLGGYALYLIKQFSEKAGS